MEYAKESIVINNDYKLEPFAIKCDDLRGIIMLHNNKKTDTIRITRRNVPITEEQKWSFYYQRSGYNKGSYITKENNPEAYSKWLHLMYDIYSNKKAIAKIER